MFPFCKIMMIDALVLWLQMQLQIFFELSLARKSSIINGEELWDRCRLSLFYGSFWWLCDGYGRWEACTKLGQMKRNEV